MDAERWQQVDRLYHSALEREPGERSAFLRMFQGETVSDTPAAVLTKEPEWAPVSAKVQRLLRKCVVRMGSPFSTAEAYLYDQEGTLIASGRGTYFTAAPK